MYSTMSRLCTKYTAYLQPSPVCDCCSARRPPPTCATEGMQGREGNDHDDDAIGHPTEHNTKRCSAMQCDAGCGMGSTPHCRLVMCWASCFS
jgi:hypothetical protein